jgi:hypothetical protein
MIDKPSSLHPLSDTVNGDRASKRRPLRGCARVGNKGLYCRGTGRRELLGTPNALAKRPRQDRYGDIIIDDPARFDAIEVHNLCEFVDTEGAVHHEADCDHDETNCFGVYAHLTEGGIDCCGDFSLREDALTYGRELAEKHDWPHYDHTSLSGMTATERRHQGALLEMALALQMGYHQALENLDPRAASDLALAGLVHSMYTGVLGEIWLLLKRSQDQDI